MRQPDKEQAEAAGLAAKTDVDGSVGSVDARVGSVDASVAAVLAALPDQVVDPAFAQRVRSKATGELLSVHGASGWRRTERLFARVVLPAALLACAAGWVHHFVQVAERIYVSHGG
jgi:hypothetical protein